MRPRRFSRRWDADAQVGALRGALARPAAGEVQHLAGDRRDRQGEGERVEGVLVGSEVRKLRPCAQDARGEKLHVQVHRETRRHIFGADSDGPGAPFGEAGGDGGSVQGARGDPESR